MIKSYLRKIFGISKRGDAREESYYSTLEELLKNYLDSTGRKKIEITILPKKTEAGNPDFRIWDGKQHIVGYIEAKAPTIEHLDQIEKTDQLKRYLTTFSNLILTNFFEFRFYRNGALMDKVIIAKSPTFSKPIQSIGNELEFFNLLDKFFSFSLPKVYSAKTLAIELAKRTRFLRDEVIAEQLEEEEKAGKGFILGFYEAFRKYLIHGLLKEEFADLYSQTITYGLFAARTRSENGFNRKLAYDSIPHTIGILRDVFKFISLEDLPNQMEWIIDDISEILAVTDVKKILHQFFREGKGKDPIVHFYETFLAKYDPETRERRGVYYTPEPVVSYIVRSLHTILKKHFNRADGFASDTVTVLDPAAGTLTFLAEAAKLAVKEFISKYGEGGKEDFIKEHILKNFFAFELMMAPYAVGHLKMSFLLEELGYRLKDDDRFKLYLTNTLQMEELAQTEFPGMTSLSEESHLAGKVKKDQPILVILGNPPYSFKSVKNKFIENLMQLYKEDVRAEKKFGVLEDDYIKFIRFAHWKIGQTGKGILGIITNNTYLSGVITRGMRRTLLETFDKAYILNVHGSSRIGERTPKGDKDENVFDIQQGVAISLYIKQEKTQKEKKVYYFDLWGIREKKYKYLLENNLNTTKWQELIPAKPYYFFVPKDFTLQKKYEKFWNIQDIFRCYISGVQTKRDKFVISFDKNELETRMLMFANLDISDEVIKKTFKLPDGSDINLRNARESVKKENISEIIKKYHYRPFDYRRIYYSDSVVSRTRKNIMKNLFQDNLAIVTTRVIPETESKGAFITSIIGDLHIFSGQCYFFPLYLYPGIDKSCLFNQINQPKEKQSNISTKIFTTLYEIYKKESSSEDIFYYIYAILYSNNYRTKYAEFLKIDFPKIPFPLNYKIFSIMIGYRKTLIDMHLLKSKELDTPVAKCQGKGDKKVGKLRYDEKEKRLYFNQSQYFEGITEEIWNCQIGGYQVCDKWLKDRKGETLLLNDIKHYCKIVTALKKTIELQKEIDKLYPKIEQRIIEFKTD